MGSKITVHKLQQGEAKVGCDPRGVQIFYKENTNVPGDQNRAYLSGLLQKWGFEVTDGDRVSGTPMRYLCVAKTGATVKTEDVLDVLKEDTEIDLENLHRPEGNRGNT